MINGGHTLMGDLAGDLAGSAADAAINGGRSLLGDLGGLIIDGLVAAVPVVVCLAYWIALIYGAFCLMGYFATRNKKYWQRTAVCVIGYATIAAIGSVVK
jgi:hypothetical protein